MVKTLALIALLVSSVAIAKPKKKPAPKADDTSKAEPAGGTEAPDPEPETTDPKTVKKKHKGWSSPAAGPTKSGDPELVFTFDDGPNPKTTPRVLDALAKHHIKAIFFEVGDRFQNRKAVEPIVRRIVAEGHIIGNHSMHHGDLCKTKGKRALTDEEAAAEIDDGKARIEEVTGFHTFWFRVPFGVRCDRVDRLLEERHIAHFHWDLDPQEWKTHATADKTFEYVTKHLAKLTTRNVLLMHDIKEVTAEVLPRILDWIDEENARREATHQRRIRIIQAPELAAERISPDLRAWFVDAVPGRGDLGARLASVLP